MNKLLARMTDLADPLITGGLLTLAAQDLLLLLALFSATQPHPPHDVGPFIGAPLAASLRVAWGMRRPSRWTLGLALLVALAHLPNFGPHKLFLALAGQIWPMVLLGLVLITQVALSPGCACTVQGVSRIRWKPWSMSLQIISGSPGNL